MNIWKWTSLILIVLNVGIIIWVYSMLTGTYDEVENSDSTADDSDNPEGLQVILPNATVESLINSYLSSVDDADIELSITTEAITLQSIDDILGMSVHTTFDLVPVTADDQIIFEVNNIDIGSLPLSQDSLYSIITSAAELPEGIAFGSDAKSLVIDTQIFQDELTDSIQIQTIDYSNNQWYFSIER